MSIQITMPALSPTMEEGNLVKWNVKEGDKVTTGDIIAEIETDKATMEVEAVDDGIVAKIMVPEGTNAVKVNSVIAVLAEEGEDLATVAGTTSSAPPATLTENESKPKVGSEKSGASLPSAERAFQSGDAHVSRDIQLPSDPSNEASSVSQSERIFASPLARRIALQQGLDLKEIAGTGPHGRIIRRDVESAAKSLQSQPIKTLAVEAPIAGATSAPSSDEQVLKLFNEGEYTVAPHDAMRKIIAKRLVESKLTVPHFYVTFDCNIDKLLKLRLELNAAAPSKKTEAGEKPAYKLSVNDMVVKASALALKAVPAANVSWLESGMVQHQFVDVGVAVSIPNGLITPIVRHADEKSLSSISNELKDLVKRARERKLNPTEYQGGTTSVSNMGMYGVKNFSAIINPPQATIFAIGAGEKRPIVVDNAIAVASLMSITISTDHRAVDGALAAELGQAFKNLIENPLSLLV